MSLLQENFRAFKQAVMQTCTLKHAYICIHLNIISLYLYIILDLIIILVR